MNFHLIVDKIRLIVHGHPHSIFPKDRGIYLFNMQIVNGRLLCFLCILNMYNSIVNQK